MAKKKEPTLAQVLDAAFTASPAKTMSEFRRSLGISNGAFYALRKTGKVCSLHTLQALKSAKIAVPEKAIEDAR